MWFQDADSWITTNLSSRPKLYKREQSFYSGGGGHDHHDAIAHPVWERYYHQGTR